MDKDQLKNTLLLPQTNFPMQAKLSEKEPEILKRWEKIDLYNKMQEKRKGSSTFFLLDGPPYANGELHLGHVLNKVLKDIVVKYKSLSGFHSPFIPTWDCHGLPIELQTLKKLGDKKETLSAKEIRACCRKEAFTWIEKQKAGFKRLGVLARWEKPILTMESDYEAEEVRALATLINNGLLYRGNKPVFWCVKLQTALAFSEAEYRDHKSPSIYVGFPATKKMLEFFKIKEPCSVVIWTTTPWTLQSNEAICLHAHFEYGLYEGEQGTYLLATGLKESFMQETGIKNLNLKKIFKGKELEGLTAQHPFLNKESPLVLGDHITLSSGTGCVHTAPSHGLEDYVIGKKYNLPLRSFVDERGHFTEGSSEDLIGAFILKGNKIIIKKLKESGHLLGEKTIVHSYPYNPRSDSPLIYRLTPQWFLKLDGDKNSIRSQALEAKEKHIHFIPEWGKFRLEGMLQNSPDWCLSRQRMWGVPLIVFYCQKCKSPYLNSKDIRHIADQMEKTKEGIEYYFSRPEKELLSPDAKCKECGHSSFKKGTDILDVWFDSGVEHAIFRKKQEEGTHFPADLFLEGSDQHRGWFQTSLISSLSLDGTIPFKTLLTHGFVNDSEGRKMSKSLGNGIDPFEVMEKSGADILRLWVSSEDYSTDINAGTKSFQRVTETYRRFRNTIRFMLGNLNHFNFKEDHVNFDDLLLSDKWVLIQLNKLIQNCETYYSQFTFHKVYQNLNQFFTTTLSAFYLDIIKDRLYTFPKKSKERRSAQTTLYYLLDNLLSLMSPISTFLSEEGYSYFSNGSNESIFLKDFPKPKQEWKDSKIETFFETLFPLKEELNKQLEELRNQKKIRSSLESRIELGIPKETLLPSFTSQQQIEFFSVSEVMIRTQQKELSIKILPQTGQKCLRCWFYTTEINNDQICPKCVKNLEGESV